jgi:Holliday junction resolvase
MGASSRRKGVGGEREVAHLLETCGFEVRNLEGKGDHLIVRAGTIPLHIETKRQERIQLPLWLRQAEREAPPGAIAVVAFRQSHSRWYAALPLLDLAELLTYYLLRDDG